MAPWLEFMWFSKPTLKGDNTHRFLDTQGECEELARDNFADSQTPKFFSFKPPASCTDLHDSDVKLVIDSHSTLFIMDRSCKAASNSTIALSRSDYVKDLSAKNIQDETVDKSLLDNPMVISLAIGLAVAITALSSVLIWCAIKEKSDDGKKDVDENPLYGQLNGQFSYDYEDTKVTDVNLYYQTMESVEMSVISAHTLESNRANELKK